MRELVWPLMQGGVGAGSDAVARKPPPPDLEAEVTALFHELRAPVLRYSASLGLPVTEGEDVVQEVFLALFRHLRAGRPRDNLRGWVLRTAHNLTLKRRLQQIRTTTANDTAADFADPAPNPEDCAAFSAAHQRAAAVIRALPARDRHCLLLRSEGLRYREIAAALDMSLGAVAASLARSMNKLAVVTQP